MKAITFALSAALFAGQAGAFELTSPDVAEGQTLNDAQVYSGFGCSGGNLSPA